MTKHEKRVEAVGKALQDAFKKYDYSAPYERIFLREHIKYLQLQLNALLPEDQL